MTTKFGKHQDFDDKSPFKTSLEKSQGLIRGPGVSSGEKQEQLICGPVSQINPNEQINAILIDSFGGVASLPVDGVIFFEDSDKGHRLAQLFLNNADLLDIEPVNLKGYPGADYNAKYEQLCWNLPNIAFDELVSEIVSDDRINRMKREEAGAKQKLPKREQTLERNRTSHFDDFTVAAGSDEEDTTDEPGN